MKKIKYKDLILDGSTNIVPDYDFKRITADTINAIADNLSITLGPFGSNVFIKEETVGHFMTKDGFTVLNNMFFPGEISGSIHSTIKNISEGLVMKVGDGSTSSILAARHLYNILANSSLLKQYRPKDIMDALDEISKEAGSLLYSKYSTRIDEHNMELIEDVATVSLNNDKKLGKLIFDIYNEIGIEGFINVKTANKESIDYTVTEGFQIDSGYIDKILVNNSDTNENILKNAKIIMFDATLSDNRFIPMLDKLMKLMVTRKEPLIIIAPNFGQTICAFFRQFYSVVLKNSIIPEINIIKVPNFTEDQMNKFEDLAIKTGSFMVRVSDDEDLKIDFTNYDFLNEKIFGNAELVKSDEKKTTIIGGKGNTEMIEARIHEVRTKLKEITVAEDVLGKDLYQLKKRLATLTDKLVTINVGGISEQAKLADKALIDDAVAACKSALIHGYTEGCNFGLLKALNELQDVYEPDVNMIGSSQDMLKYELIRILFESISGVYKEVLANANMYTSFEKISEKIKANEKPIDITGHNNLIINSVETDVEILKNINSIIGLIITSKAMLTKKPLSFIYDEEDK